MALHFTARGSQYVAQAAERNSRFSIPLGLNLTKAATALAQVIAFEVAVSYISFGELKRHMHIAVKGFIHGNKRFSNKNNVIFCGKCYFMLTTKNRPADCGIIMQKKQVYFKNITPEHNCALFEGIIELTRPDTRPIPVADGWAGAEMRVF